MRKRIMVAGTFVLCMSAMTASAGEFENIGTSFWHDAANWTLVSGTDAGGDGIPGAGDTASIKVGTLVEMHAPHAADAVTIFGNLRGSTNAAAFDLSHTIGSITIKNGGVFELADGREAETVTTTVTGDFTIENGGLLKGAAFGNLSTITLAVEGDYTDLVTAGFSALGGGSTSWTIRFQGAAAATMTLTAGASSDFGSLAVATGKELTIVSPRPVFVTSGNGFTVENGGTLLLADGAFFFGGGNFTLSTGGTLGVAAATGLVRSALFQNSGTTTLPTDANYLFNGVGGQDTGVDLPATVNSLTVDTADWVTLSANVSVSGQLNLVEGRIDTGANVLYASANEADIVVTSGYVNGNLARTVDAAVTGSRLFPVGTANGYSPVVIDITSAGTGFGFLSVNATEGAHTPAPTNPAIPRYWTINGGAYSGFEATLAFTYTDGDAGSLDESQFKAARFEAPSTFTVPAAQSASPATNTVTATGVTAFSDWLIIEDTTSAVHDWIEM